MVVEDRTRDEGLVHEIEPAVQDELAKHPGKWVALTRTAILAVKDTSTEAYAAAQAMGVAAPILFHVPDGHPRTFYY